MQYVDACLNFIFLPVAANDNEDLLAFSSPAIDLALIRDIKCGLRAENAETGMLLSSRKQRRFFQEVIDAEHYILLRYFTIAAPESALRRLKRRILDRYLVPKPRRKRKSAR